MGLLHQLSVFFYFHTVDCLHSILLLMLTSPLTCKGLQYISSNSYPFLLKCATLPFSPCLTTALQQCWQHHCADNTTVLTTPLCRQQCCANTTTLTTTTWHHCTDNTAVLTTPQCWQQHDTTVQTTTLCWQQPCSSADNTTVGQQCCANNSTVLTPLCRKHHCPDNNTVPTTTWHHCTDNTSCRSCTEQSTKHTTLLF